MKIIEKQSIITGITKQKGRIGEKTANKFYRAVYLRYKPLFYVASNSSNRNFIYEIKRHESYEIRVKGFVLPEKTTEKKWMVYPLSWVGFVSAKVWHSSV